MLMERREQCSSSASERQAEVEKIRKGWKLICQLMLTGRSKAVSSERKGQVDCS